MEIKVGEYYRTKKGLIRQVKTINTPETRKAKKIGWTKNNVPLVNGRHTLDDIAKHSNNIIDLIECGDYVNGERVICFRSSLCDYDIGTTWRDDFGDYIGVDEEDIKSILTKEQFSSLEYII